MPLFASESALPRARKQHVRFSVCIPMEEYPKCNMLHLSTDSWHIALTILLYNIILQNKWLSLTMALPRILATLLHLLKVSLPLHKFTVCINCINTVGVDFWGSGCWNSSSWSYWCPSSLNIRFSENIRILDSQRIRISDCYMNHWTLEACRKPSILWISFLGAEFRWQFMEFWVEDKRDKRQATALTAGWGEPIPHHCLRWGPGCSSLADFNLSSTAYSKVLNFSSIHALIQGVSLRTLRSDKGKPIGNKTHQAYDEFRLSVDGWMLLKHCCRTLSCLLSSSVRVWSPKCNNPLTWFTGLELYSVSNNINCRILRWFIYWSY